MSTPRVKYLKQYFGITSATWNANVLTVVTPVAHNLYNGMTVTMVTPNNPQQLTGTVTVSNTTTFTIACEAAKNVGGWFQYFIAGFLPGQTGGVGAHTIPRGTGATMVVQSYVVGTGGATYTIDLSLDGVHWTASGTTVTHGTTDNDTQSATIAPGWAYMRPNITSIGAATNLVIMTAE